MAETEVGSELSKVPKVTIEEKCALDMSSYEDLLNVGGDRNGDKKHVDEESEEEAGEDNNVNVNASGNVNGKDDTDGSYVFVSRCDSADGNPVDGDRNVECIPESPAVCEPLKVSSLNEDEVEGRVGELNVENGQTVSVEDNSVAASVDISFGSEVINPNGDDDIVLTKDQNSTVILESEVINPEVDEGCVSAKDQNSKANLEEGSASAEDQNSKANLDSEVFCPSVDEDSISSKDQNSTAILEPEIQQYDGKVEDKIDPDFAPQQEAPEAPTLVSDVSDFGTAQLDDGKIDSGKLSNLESTAGSGEIQESDIVVSEVDFVHDGKEKFKEQDNIESTPHVTGREEMQDQDLVAADHKSSAFQESNLVVSKVDLVHVGKERSLEQDNIKSTSHITGSEEVQDVDLAAADCKSPLLEDGKMYSQEHAITMDTSASERSQESEDKVSDTSRCKLPEFEVRMVTAEPQTKLDSADRDEESSDTQFTMPNSAESESESFGLDNREAKVEEEEKIDLREDIKENQKSLPMIMDNAHSGTDKGNEEAKLDNETDLMLERENTVMLDLDENDGSSPPSHTEDNNSKSRVLNESSDGSPDKTALSGSSGYPESLPFNGDCVRAEFRIEPKQVEKLPPCPTHSVNLENGALSSIVGDATVTGSNDVSAKTDSGPSSSEPKGKVSDISCTDSNIDSEFPIKVTDNACSKLSAMDSLDLQHGATDSQHNGSDAGMKSESEVENSCISKVEMPCNDTAVSHSDYLDGSGVNSERTLACVPEALNVQDGKDKVSEDGGDKENLACQKTKDTKQVQRGELSICSPEKPSADILDEQVQKGEISTCLPEEPRADVLDEQSAGVEAMKRPFHFLIKVPRFEDEKLSEQIRHAQLQVDEKTQRRGVIRENIKIIKASYQQLQNNYEAAKSEERAARGLVKLKRQEIDSVQSLINRVKNAMSVDDIDMRIHNMEHMIQHETLPLKEEKQFIREIKQLKQLRDQLSSNMGSQDEVQQALDQRDQIEDQLKVLKKELDRLKEKVSKAEAIVEAAWKKCSEEGKKLKELNAQYKAADDIRQEAYTHFQNLRGKLNEKQFGFRAYKDESAAAKKYASKGDKEAVHRLCVNQVGTIMELWNKNDKFRDEYIRCNTRSTIRRFGTIDGRALGPDESRLYCQLLWMKELMDLSLPLARPTRSHKSLLRNRRSKWPLWKGKR
ncbi:hypothetical protein NMG60_11024583 [Bertholletia excelsa]